MSSVIPNEPLSTKPVGANGRPVAGGSHGAWRRGGVLRGDHPGIRGWVLPAFPPNLWGGGGAKG